MKNITLPVVFLLALSSCGDHKSASETAGSIKKDTVQSLNTTRNPRANTGKTVVDTATVYNEEYATKHYFSNLKEKDSFSLKITGSDLSKSKGVLQIKNAQNELIYEYKFATIDFLIDPESLPVVEQTKQIGEILKHYFDEEKFKSPAIKATEKFENAFPNPDYTEKTAWEGIKTNRKAISFLYQEGYEGLSVIAYSSQMKKAISVFYSD